MNASSSSSKSKITTSRLEDGQERRPPASSILWAHLLRKDNLVNPTNKDIPLPPVAPVDKSATSTRILLHDTQANLQKFGERVDRLTSRIDEAKHEITAVKTLFKDEHETLVSEIVDLVNRSQNEVKKSVGVPAQADKLEELRQSLVLRIEGLDKRIDAIQMFHQTHSQILQSQMQALQALQDQQCSIITSLTPLLPLLQALPLHIEAARNTINESLSKSMESIQLNTISPIRKLQLARKVSGQDTDTRKRTSTPSSHSRKRQRLDENQASENVQAFRRSQIFAVPSPRTERQSPLARKSSALYSEVNNSRDVSSMAATKSSALSSLIAREPSLSFRRSSTPRRPLADLPLFNRPTSSHSKSNNKTNYHEPVHQAFQEKCQNSLAVTCTPSSRYSHPSSRIAGRSPSKRDTDRSPTVSVTDGALSRPPTSSSPTLELNLKNRAQFTTIPTFPARQIPATPLNPNSRFQSTPRTPAAIPPTIYTNVQVPMKPGSTGGTPTISRVTRESVPRSLPVVGVPIPVPPTLRQRRSPFREGRRFIPLDDSDESDEQGE